MTKKTIPFNTMPDGTCRTIKAQYYKNSLANFLRGGGYGASAVAVCESDWESVEQQAERKGV